jgi:hypothetical protein
MIPATLFRAALGSDLDAISACVQDLHRDDRGARIAGTVEIRTARRLLGRVLCLVAGIPRIDGPAPAELRIERCGAGERWRRAIGPWRFSSVATPEPGAVIERKGMIEMRLALSVTDGGIRFDQTAAYLRALGLKIRLPRFLAPRVEAFERPGADGCSAEIGVTLRAPLAGVLVSYTGCVRRDPA